MEKRGLSLIIKESNERVRCLSEEEIDYLLAECKPTKHLHRIVTCAINTGGCEEEKS